jgi:hypothetical protein
MAVLVKFAWPKQLEDVQSPDDDRKGGAGGGH